jgi:hypothetical protein
MFDSFTTIDSTLGSSFEEIFPPAKPAKATNLTVQTNPFQCLNQQYSNFNTPLSYASTMPPSQMHASGPYSPPPSPTDIFEQSLLVYQQPIQNQPNPNAPKPLTASQKKKIRENARNLVCNNCKTTKTPLWRRSNCKSFNLCNACGLYEKQYGEQRPVSYVHKPPRASVHRPSSGLGAPIDVLKRQGSVTLSWSQLEQIVKIAKSGL